MAFNNLGPLTLLNPGQTAYWWYMRNGGQDFGTQFASADVKTPNAGAVHVAFDQKKEGSATQVMLPRRPSQDCSSKRST